MGPLHFAGLCIESACDQTGPHWHGEPRSSAQDERTAVVAYLRQMSERGASRLSDYARAFADSIERGEHVR